MPLHPSEISALYKKSMWSKIRSLVKCSYGCKNKLVTSEAIFSRWLSPGLWLKNYEKIYFLSYSFEFGIILKVMMCSFNSKQ